MKTPNVKLNYDCDNCIHGSVCMYRRPELEITNFQKALIKAVTGKEFDKKNINDSDSPITFVADCDKFEPVLSYEEMAYCGEDARVTAEANIEFEKLKTYKDVYDVVKKKVKKKIVDWRPWKDPYSIVVWFRDGIAGVYTVEGRGVVKRVKATMPEIDEYFELDKNTLPKKMSWICEYCGVKYEGPLNEKEEPMSICRGCGTEDYSRTTIKPSVKGGDSNE